MSVKTSFYKLHRVFGLIAIVPVICWTLSGLSHPFMSNWFRPFIPVEVYKPPVQSEVKPALSIQQVLHINDIIELRNFGLVSFNKASYYQVLGKDSVCNYYSADDGALLKNGDQLYAVWLARYFTQDSVSAIKSIRLQKTFDGQYQPINHLLPVWKVSFARSDGMDVYIETGQSRMGTFNNNTRKALLWVFEQLHTWEFLAAIAGDTFRNVFLLSVIAVMCFSLLSGLTIYGLFWKKFKAAAQKRRENRRYDKRFLYRYHRKIGLYVSFVMLTFVISAAFHLVVKLHNGDVVKAPYAQLIDRKELGLSNLKLPVADSTIIKIGLAKFNNQAYYQVSNNKKAILYFDTKTGTALIDGDKTFAAFLSDYYHPENKEIKQANGKLTVSQVRQFDNEYGFINKRLPVQKVSYPGNKNWYIETTTAKLATKVNGLDRAEGFSFIFLHKFFYMSWAGKNIRDIVSMLAALGVLVVAVLGFLSFIKNK
ncbi:PepSY-associated TM helix domain-containing protein [Mucilaginibacter sp. OK098]|uniref:PepSY-associated TM helix domain-containing protein n=1 Tax=Mucilaginibacter sp. OK098 TaxID=1855297 RepID=UPI00092477D6|nr:PepSY-associated TM helix domain-containing protein [Mucilaginibacter sp. OK098]SHN36991.1 PepSY-associated TM region [Mucilaginibacter sp. OK098]